MLPSRILCFFTPLQKIDPEVAAFLQKLRSRVQIGVVGGSDYSKIAEQLGDGDEGRRRGPEPVPCRGANGGSEEFRRSLDHCAFKDPVLLLGCGRNSQMFPFLIQHTFSELLPCARLCARLWRDSR